MDSSPAWQKLDELLHLCIPNQESEQADAKFQGILGYTAIATTRNKMRVKEPGDIHAGEGKRKEPGHGGTHL